MSSYSFFLYYGERAEEDTRMDCCGKIRMWMMLFVVQNSIHWPNLWRAKLDFYDYYTFCFPLFHRMSCMLWPTPQEKRVGSPSLRAGVTTKDFWPHRNILWRWVLGQHYVYPKIQAIYISCRTETSLLSTLWQKLPAPGKLLWGTFYCLIDFQLIFSHTKVSVVNFFKGTL